MSEKAPDIREYMAQGAARVQVECMLQALL